MIREILVIYQIPTDSLSGFDDFMGSVLIVVRLLVFNGTYP